jgi:hypothetical protein
MEKIVKEITMKTLDEVIAELEDEELFADALFYLKEYKSDKEELDSTRLAYLDILTDYVALKNNWAEQQENPPLTWDELKTMQKKPVWVELPNGGYWIIIDRFGLSKNDGTEYMETMQNRFWKENYGSWWKAYKRETK